MEREYFEKAEKILSEISDIEHSIARLKSSVEPMFYFHIKVIDGVQELFDAFSTNIFAIYKKRLKELETEFSQM